MIERYSRPEMANIWTRENLFTKWLEVELAVCDVYHKQGKIPTKSYNVIKKKAGFKVKEIDRIELKVKHDVIAFLTSVANHVGPDSRFIHMGLTSSDVIDTSFALLLKESSDLLIDDIKRLMKVLKRRALQHKMTPSIGRSHGIHGEPTSFGLKILQMYDEMGRNLERLKRAQENISVGQLSGPVGNFSNIDPSIEREALKKLKLKAEPVSTQIVHRDRHAEFFTTLALIATSIEKFAVEIRHLQRTEVLEAEEPFGKGQKGSSAMPHKKNPILSENLTGLARLVRSYSISAMENIPLWHERDISHSSVERVIAPDATILLDFMLNRFIGLMDGLVVHKDNMQKNIDLLNGLVFSQSVLLKLIDKGITREDAYKIVQDNAMRVWKEKVKFVDILLEDEKVMSKLSAADVKSCFDVKPYLKHVDYIFKRTLNKK